MGVALLLVSGCGAGGESTAEEVQPPADLQKIHLGLDGTAGPLTAPISLAERRDYFEEEGLEITTTSPGSRLSPMLYVVSEEVDIGISHLPEVALAIEQGEPIIAVGSLVPEATAALIWPRDSGIEDMPDLKGKTIAFTGLPFQREILESVVSREGLEPGDVKLEEVSYEVVSALLDGRADAILADSPAIEGQILESQGLKPVVTELRDLGVPDYEELVLIARRDRLAKEPLLYRNFLAAVTRGAAQVAENPEAAASSIIENVNASGEMDRPGTEAAVEAMLPFLSGDGRMDPERAEQLTEWMQEEGMLEQALPASELLTNKYLPPQS